MSALQPKLFPSVTSPTIDSAWKSSPFANLQSLWAQARQQEDLGPWQQEFLSLLKENDVDLLREACLNLARRLRSRGREDLASIFDSSLQFDSRPDRAEHFLNQFAQETLNPIGLGAMGLASFAYQATRLKVLSGLLANSKMAWWNRGSIARILANTCGFLAEVPVFSLGQHFGNFLVEKPRPRGKQNFFTEMQESAWFLGAMKLGGAAGQGARARWLRNFGKEIRVIPTLIAQGGLYGGILLGRGIVSGGEVQFRQGLETLFQFHISGRILQGLSTAEKPQKPGQILQRVDVAAAASPFDSALRFWEIRLPPRLFQAALAKKSGGNQCLFNALDRLFRYDAAGTSIGSARNALWQHFFQTALKDADTAQGDRAILSAIAVFESGGDAPRLEQLWKNFNYAESPLSLPEQMAIRRSLINLAPANGISSVETAADRILRSPTPRFLSARLERVLRSEDIPAKVLEIQAPHSWETPSYLEWLRHRGLALEEQALNIDGTEHNAHFRDLRLARKVASVHEDIHSTLVDPSNRLRRLAKARLDFSEVRKGHPELGVPALLEFLLRNGDPQGLAFLKAVETGGLEVEMLSERSFRNELLDGDLPATSLSVFLKPRDPAFPSLIRLRALEAEAHGSDSGQVFDSFMRRVVATFHEWEHYRHFHGEFGARERLSSPFDIRHLDREQRLISETMAVLEQLRWGILHWNDDFYRVGRHMGENLVQFARSYSDHGYFSTGP